MSNQCTFGQSSELYCGGEPLVLSGDLLVELGSFEVTGFDAHAVRRIW